MARRPPSPRMTPSATNESSTKSADRSALQSDSPPTPGAERRRRPGCLCTRSAMSPEPKMVLQQEGNTWIGWIDNIPGINSQADTREELITNLQSALSEWHEL